LGSFRILVSFGGGESDGRGLFSSNRASRNPLIFRPFRYRIPTHAQPASAFGAKRTM